MATTAHLALTLVEQSQSQKEVTVNEAFKRIDALLNTGVIDKDLSAPPGSPANGDLYIVGSSATGEWAGKEKQIAYYDQTWKFIQPRAGITLWVADEDALYRYNGTNWNPVIGNTLGGLTDVDITSPAQYDILQHDGTQFVNTSQPSNINRLGINATADAANRLAVKSAAILFDHNGSDSQVKVNKSASGSKASHLFQSNLSGRAEFGLIGNDDFTLKVSSDGTTFNESFVVDRTTGNIDFKKQISVSGSTFRRSVWIRPEMLRPSATSGCAPLAVVSMGAGKPDLQSFDFDASAIEYLEFSLPMPKSWNEGTVTAQYLWSHASTTTNFGIVWSLQGLACGDADSMNASFGSVANQVDTGGTADALYISPESPAVTIGGTPAENDMVFFRISRNATHVNDTLAVDARLHAIRLFITTNSLSD